MTLPGTIWQILVGEESEGGSQYESNSIDSAM